MKKCGIHIIDTNGALTEVEIKKLWGINHKIDTVAKRNIERYEKFSVLFTNHLSEFTPEKLKERAYHYAKVEMDAVRILHQGAACWSVFNLDEKNISRKAEQVSQTLSSKMKYTDVRVFVVDASEELFSAQGFMNGNLIFDFQIGSLINNIGVLPISLQQKYLEKRHFEKTDPHLIEDFFRPERRDLLEKIYHETCPEQLVVLFEEMLSIQLFFDF